MRIGALVLGIVGGIFGIVAALLALSIGGIGSAVGAQGAGTVLGLAWWAFGFCLLGFVGAGIAMAKPGLSALLLLIASVGFLISVSWFALITAPLFLIASLLAFAGRGRTAAASAG
jgi:hypothetical protein